MRLVIHGMAGRPLVGTIPISGAKNASLPLMAACLLSDDHLKLSQVPHLSDIDMMAQLLRHLGVTIKWNRARQEMVLTSRDLHHFDAPYEAVSRMRASILVLGPLLARYGQARVALPGGCAIGNRPIDYHLQGLRQLGAQLDVVGGDIIARVTARLKGCRIVFPSVSVGATENLLMAACLAEGDTELVNCAQEPEISDLAKCLCQMGAQIEGIGSSFLRIQGRPRLAAAEHRVIADRIEAGSYALATVACGGHVVLESCQDTHMHALWTLLMMNGITIRQGKTGTHVIRQGQTQKCRFDATTAPYPGFPTDLQAQLMATACVVGDVSVIRETIFENRFMHVAELKRMNAHITTEKDNAMIQGGTRLIGTDVKATDLRSSMGLVIAALAADGKTIIHHAEHLQRGYQDIEKKLSSLGAYIKIC